MKKTWGGGGEKGKREQKRERERKETHVGSGEGGVKSAQCPPNLFKPIVIPYFSQQTPTPLPHQQTQTWIPPANILQELGLLYVY